RLSIHDLFLDVITQIRQQSSQAKRFVQKFHQAASPEHIQSEWHLQQWWILIAGFILFTSILMFAFTQPLTASKFEAEYLRKVDPQIYALLDGKILTAPTEVDEQLIIEALQEESLANHAVISAQSLNLNIEDIHINPNISTADRKWHKMNPRF